MNISALNVSLVASSFLLLGGCASQSVWEQNMSRSTSSSAVALAPLEKAASVLVRDVSWDRLQNVLIEIEAARAASDLHVSEWSDNQKSDEKAKLLRGLQVSQNAAAVTVVGHSQFKTTDSLGDPRAALTEVARKLGVNMVVYSTRVLGKADKIVQEPVSSNKFGTVWYRDRDDRYRNESYNEQQTTWVPVRVSADEVGAMAFFLRVE